MRTAEVKGYYEIDEMLVKEGLLEMWESEKHGDEVRAIVTLNGHLQGKTWDSLREYYKTEFEEV